MSHRCSAFLPPFRVGPNHVRPQFDGRCSKLKTFACTFAYSAPETHPLGRATYIRESSTRERTTARPRISWSIPLRSIDLYRERAASIDSSFDELNFRFDELANSILLFFFSFTNIYLLIDREYFSRITTTTDVSFTFRVTCKSANNRRDYHIECKPRVKRSLVFHSSPITRVDWSRPWTRGIAKPAIFKKTGTRYWNAGRGRSAIG